MRVKDGVVERVAVRTGIRDGGLVEITEGLAEGDRVVTRPAPSSATATGSTQSPPPRTEDRTMNFSAWSIRNPVAPLLAFFLLMVLGWQSFNSLPITRFPNIDVPLVAVSVAQSGAAPAEMESQVTKEIEDAVADGSVA